MQIPKPEEVRARIEARRLADEQGLMRACLDAIADMDDSEKASVVVPPATPTRTRDAVVAALRKEGWEVSVREGDSYDHDDRITIALPTGVVGVRS